MSSLSYLILAGFRGATCLEFKVSLQLSNCLKYFFLVLLIDWNLVIRGDIELASLPSSRSTISMSWLLVEHCGLIDFSGTRFLYLFSLSSTSTMLCITDIYFRDFA